jgi:hypothetical protein
VNAIKTLAIKFFRIEIEFGVSKFKNEGVGS